MKGLGKRRERLGRGKGTATGIGHTVHVMTKGEQQPTTFANNTLDLSRSSRWMGKNPKDLVLWNCPWSLLQNENILAWFTNSWKHGDLNHCWLGLPSLPGWLCSSSWSLTFIFLNLSKTSIWNSKGCPNPCTSHANPCPHLDVFPSPIPQPLLSHSLGWRKCYLPGDMDKQQSLVWLQSGSSSINKGQTWLFKATWEGQDLTADGEAMLLILPTCVLGTVEVWLEGCRQ